MELDILRSEAELFTTEMSQEEREEAGYYRLQHENDRLRQALVALKEMTTEQEHDSQRRIRELQQDVSSVDELRQEAAELKDQASEHVAIVEHLRAQVDASAEWEDVSNDLTAKNQELEDKVTSQGLTIQDLESLRELNDELELQHAQEEEEMRAELDAKYIELAELYERIETQHAEIVDQEDLIGKFRGLVLDLQSRMHAAESSKIMTDAQVKDATGRFNEVMDINRQLRAATLTNVSREIDARLSTLAAAMASEELKIFAVTKSTEFQDSQPMRCYFTAKRVASKANILSKAIESIGQQISTSGRLDETFVRLDCNEAVGHLSVIHLGSERLARAS
jgi:dynactin 1